jgi:hypothetical protein
LPALYSKRTKACFPYTDFVSIGTSAICRRMCNIISQQFLFNFSQQAISNFENNTLLSHNISQAKAN